MEKALSLVEVSTRMVELVLADHTDTQVLNLNGVTSYTTRGHLAGGRYANVRIAKDKDIMHIGLTVPGMGGLGVHFSLFADEATDARVERYLDYYLGLHEEAVMLFKKEQESAA